MTVPIDPQSLASLAGLQGTLSGPSGILTLSEALNQRAMEAAQQRTTQATSEAAKAGQQYQQAAGAPMQQPDALAQMLPLLTGNIASVIAQDPNFAKRGQQNVAQQRADLAQTRADNLMALKDNYDKKALLAAHLGDNETEMDMRQRSDQLSKTLEVLLKTQDENAAKDRLGIEHTNRMAEISAQGQNALNTANLRTGNDATPTLTDFVHPYSLRNGSTVAYVDPEEAKNLTPKARSELTIMAKKAGVLVPSDQRKQATDLIGSVQGDMDNVRNNIVPLLAATQGKGFVAGAQRMVQSAGKKAEAFFQTPGEGSTLAAYPAYRTAAIKTIQALAALGKGLRINQAEINAAMNFDYPTLNDSQETANKKLDILSTMLDHVESAAMGKPPTDAEVAQVLKAIRDLKAGNATNVNVTAPKVIRYDKAGKVLTP